MEDSQYTLPGVMRFLRSEWQRREREKIEWDIERADMRSRIARLEAEKLELQRERDEARRHLDIMSLRFRPSEDTADAAAASTATAANGHAVEPESENEHVTESVLATVSESRTYLGQCIADIRSVLSQSGMIQGDFVPIAPYQPAFGSDRCVTLANFGTAASAVAVVAARTVVAGTVDGDILVWGDGAREPTVVEHLPYPVNFLAYSEATQRLFAAAGSQLIAYSAGEGETLERVAAVDVARAVVLDLAVSDKGNMVAAVQENGDCTVFSLVGGTRFSELSKPSTCAHACGFVELDDEVHLAIATSTDSSEPASTSESGILFVDPLTGQKLKKIVFAAAAGVGALATMAEIVVVGTDSGDLRAIGLTRGETIAEVPSAHRGEITSLSVVKKDTIVSTSTDGRVSLWSLPDLLWKGRLFSHDSGYGALSSARLQDGIVIGGGDGLVRIYREK